MIKTIVNQYRKNHVVKKNKNK